MTRASRFLMSILAAVVGLPGCTTSAESHPGSTASQAGGPAESAGSGDSEAGGGQESAGATTVPPDSGDAGASGACMQIGSSCGGYFCCHGTCLNGTCQNEDVAGSANGGAHGGTSGSSGGQAGLSHDTCGSNLLLGDLGTTGNWVGGDPADRSDNPCGIQGMLTAYGDGVSCTLPADNNPCSAGQCCIEGHTVVDPTYAPWGCGMGLSLNDSGGNPSIKSPYTPGVDGTVTGFRVTLSGNSAAEVRISYTQVADTTGVVSPFRNGSTGASDVTVPGTYDVMFMDVSCPTWGTTQGCTPGGPTPYDIQVQVVGGVVDGDFDLCITELTPLMD